MTEPREETVTVNASENQMQFPVWLNKHTTVEEKEKLLM